MQYVSVRLSGSSLKEEPICRNRDGLMKTRRGRFGQPTQELAEIKHYFGTMAKTSGALWEFADGHDSRCHGFGSYVAVLILRDILGVKEIDAQTRCVSISPGESPLVSAAAAVRTSAGTLVVRLLRESGRSVRHVELPSGWTAN